MKKLVLLVATCIVINYIQAQVITQVGIKGGGLSTWILNSNVMAGNSDTTYRLSGGYTVGAHFGLYFNKRTYYSHTMKGVQLEVNYTSHRQGYKSKTGTPIDYKYAWNLTYIDFGLYFQYMPSSDHGFYMLVGPQYSILMGAKDKGYVEIPNVARTSYDNDITSKLAGGNFQMVLEMGQYFNSLKTPQLGFHVGLRLNYGINDITKPLRDSNPGQTYFRNNTAYIGLVLGIDLKSRNYYN